MTPLHRGKNYGKLIDSIVPSAFFMDGKITWWVAVDEEYWMTESRGLYKIFNYPFHAFMWYVGGEDFAGHKKRNSFLDHCKDGYIYFLDDDNLIHPELFKNLVGKLDGTSIIMDQYNKDDSLRLSHTEPIEVGHVDVGNILINRKDIGDLRFEVDKYEADGILFNEIFVKRGVPIKRDAEAKTYYNKLR